MAEYSSYYYISPGSLSIVPNANNSPNDIAVSIASSASIMVYAPNIDIHELNWDGTNYRVWRLSAGNTRLGVEHQDKEVFIYAKLSLEAPTAQVIFTSARYTANAREETSTDEHGQEVTTTVYDEVYIKKSEDELYYWVRIGRLTAPVNGRRTLEYDSGQLGTPRGDSEKDTTELAVMWRYYPEQNIMRAQVPIGAKNAGGDVRFVDPVRIDYNVHFGADGVQLTGVATSQGDNPANSNTNLTAEDHIIATKGFTLSHFIKRAGDTLSAFFQFLGGMKIARPANSEQPALLVEGGTETDTLRVTGKVEGNLLIDGNERIEGDERIMGETLMGVDETQRNGAGGWVDEEGNANFKSITAREFIATPVFKFNKITVNEGEEWDTNGYGTFESVTPGVGGAGSATLKLEPKDIASIERMDICRGIFNVLDGIDASLLESYRTNQDATFDPEHPETYDYTWQLSDADRQTDETGFPVRPFFYTSYFFITSVTTGIGTCSFTYQLRDGYPHPCAGMKFAVYGNFENAARQSFSMRTVIPKYYQVAYTGVNSWTWTSANIAIAEGWIEGLVVKVWKREQGARTGEVVDEILHGVGFYSRENIYFGEAIHQIDPAILDEIEEDVSNYQIFLTTPSDTIVVDDAGMVIGGLWTNEETLDGNGHTVIYRRYRLHTACYVTKRNTPLVLVASDPGDGQYTMGVASTDCDFEVANGAINITRIRHLYDASSDTVDSFNYSAMRNMREIQVVFTIWAEGRVPLIQTYSIAVQHEATPFISGSLSNVASHVSYSTKLGKFVGFPVDVPMRLFRNNETLSLREFFIDVDGVRKVGDPAKTADTAAMLLSSYDRTLAADQAITGAAAGWRFALSKATGTLTIVDAPKGTIGAVNIGLSAIVRYAGVDYERRLVHVLMGTVDTNVYEIWPSQTVIQQSWGFSRNQSDILQRALIMDIAGNGLGFFVSCDNDRDEHYHLDDSLMSEAHLSVYYTLTVNGVEGNYVEQVVDNETQMVFTSGAKVQLDYDDTLTQSDLEGASRVTFYLIRDDGSANGFVEDMQPVEIQDPVVPACTLVLDNDSDNAVFDRYARLIGTMPSTHARLVFGGTNITELATWTVATQHNCEAGSLSMAWINSSNHALGKQVAVTVEHISADAYIDVKATYLGEEYVKRFSVGYVTDANGKYYVVLSSETVIYDAVTDTLLPETLTVYGKKYPGDDITPAETVKAYIGNTQNNLDITTGAAITAANFKTLVKAALAAGQHKIAFRWQKEGQADEEVLDILENGADGNGVEYIFRASAVCAGTEAAPTFPTTGTGALTLPANISNGHIGSDSTVTTDKQQDDWVPEGWYDDPISPSKALPYVWVSQRTYRNEQWGAFSTPKLWTRYPKSGDTPVALYKWYAANHIPQSAPTCEHWTAEDIASSGWSKTAPNRGTGQEDYNLWMSQNTLYGDDTLGTWSTPVRISGANGSAGEDAKDREWIYKRFTSLQNNLSAPASSGTGTVGGVSTAYADDVDDWVPSGWSDDPSGIDDTNKYEYACWRDWDTENHEWGDFCGPILWSAYGLRGMDGAGVEYVFVRTADDTKPQVYGSDSSYTDSASNDYNVDEHLPRVRVGSTHAIKGNTTYDANGYKTIGTYNVAECTDEPQGTSEEWPYEWVLMRTKGAPNGGVRAWNAYSGSMSQWSKWSADGKRGAFQSTVFKRSNTDITTAPTGGTYDNPWPGGTNGTNGWYDSIPSGSERIWASTRTFHDPADNNEAWSTPRPMADTQSYDVEFSPSESRPADPTTANRHGGSGTQVWFDPVLDSTADWSSMKWRAERECNNGTWSNWTITQIVGEKGLTIRRNLVKNSHLPKLVKLSEQSIDSNYYSFPDTSNFGWSLDFTPMVGKTIVTSFDVRWSGIDISSTPAVCLYLHLTVDGADSYVFLARHFFTTASGVARCTLLRNEQNTGYANFPSIPANATLYADRIYMRYEHRKASPTMSSSTWLWVTNIKIETNEGATEWLSAEDDGKVVMPNLLLGSDFRDLTAWTSHIGSVITGGGPDGLTAFKAQLSSSTSGVINNTFDFLKQSVTLEASTWYTLSFWAKGTDGILLRSHIYNHAQTLQDTVKAARIIDGEAAYPAGDGSATFDLTTTWMRHTITFKTSASASLPILLFRAIALTSTTNDYYIAAPKLERGGYATAWDVAPEEKIGDDGVGVSTQHTYYIATTLATGVTRSLTATLWTSPTSIGNWSQDAFVEPTPLKPYVWRFTCTILTDDNYICSPCELIAQYSAATNPNLLEDTGFDSEECMLAWSVRDLLYRPDNGVAIADTNSEHDGQSFYYSSDSEKQYYLSSSDTYLSGGSWESWYPDAVPTNRYLWTRDVRLGWSASGTYTQTSTTQYYLSTSAYSPQGGSWDSTRPSVPDGKYLFIRKTYSYSPSSPAHRAYMTPEVDLGAYGVGLPGIPSALGHCCYHAKMSLTNANALRREILRQYLYTHGETAGNKIEKGTWYTFSFWVKGDGYINVEFRSNYLSNDKPNLIMVDANELPFVDGQQLASAKFYSYRGTLASWSPVSCAIFFKATSVWTRHTITFKTANYQYWGYDTNTDTKYPLYLRMQLYSVSDTRIALDDSTLTCNDVYICMPKLEYGMVATAYLDNTQNMRGAMPRLTKWAANTYYFSGRMGELYKDLVICENKYYECVASHYSYNSNKPGTSGGKAYWREASKQEFVATDVLLSQYVLAESGAFDGLHVKELFAVNGYFTGFQRHIPTIINSTNMASFKTKVGAWLKYDDGTWGNSAPNFGAITGLPSVNHNSPDYIIDLYTAGASMVFTNAPGSGTVVHLPFVAHNGDGEGKAFKFFFTNTADSTEFNSSPLKTNLYQELARARSFVGASVEIYNASGSGTVYVVGAFNPYADPGVAAGANNVTLGAVGTPVNMSTNGESQATLFKLHRLNSGMMARLTCKRLTIGNMFSDYTGGGVEIIYWEVEAGATGITSAEFTSIDLNNI